jgi:NCS1 family nucleobase:cation symporter-1
MAHVELEEGLTGGNNEVWSVEQHGINLIPEAERRGNPRELFWVWAAANIIITYVIVGGVLASLGLTVGQMLLIVALGNLPYVLIGYGGIPGARVGTATLVISRASFGRTGNVLPALFSWITIVGWEAVNLVLGAFALYSFVSAFGWEPGTVGKAILLAILAIFTFGVAILGHATIFYLQRFFTWALGVLILGVIPQVLTAYHASTAAAPAGASLANLCLAFTIVAALPFSYANYPADYTRYLPRKVSGSAISWWTFAGAVIPAVVITVVGYLAARTTDLTDPIGGFKPLLAPWYFDIFVLVVVGGSITNNFLNTYSSGLTLLALGLRWQRSRAILLDAVLATIASVYAIFVYDFTTAFINFLSLMIAWIAPWFGIYLVDMYLRRSNYEGNDLISADGGRYRYGSGWHAAGYVAWIIGIVASLAFTNATIFQSPLDMGPLGGADLSIVMGVAVAGALYWVLARRSIATA